MNYKPIKIKFLIQMKNINFKMKINNLVYNHNKYNVESVIQINKIKIICY